MRSFLLLLAVAGASVEGFSFWLSPRSSSRVKLADNTLLEIAPAKLPNDLEGIRECRWSSMASNQEATIWERNFCNADAAASKKVQCVVAKDVRSGRVLATADVKIRQFKKSAYISNVFVREDARGRGMGKELLKGVEDLVRAQQEKDGFSLSLDVHTRNQAALRLYRSCGYTPPGVHSIMSVVGESAGLNVLVNMKKAL